LERTDEAGVKQVEARLEGISALERISKESEKDYYWPIIQILTAYVRQHAPTPDDWDVNQEWWRPLDSDIQAIMAVLRRRTRSYGHGEPMPLDLHGTYLRHANLRRAHLRKANLQRTLLVEADLSEADLSEAAMPFVNLKGANLSEANLLNAKPGPGPFLGAAIKNKKTDISEVNLKGANLSNTYMVYAHLERSDLEGANLEGANLASSNLREANLEAAYLKDADVGDADLRGANLKRAFLEDASFIQADLEGANLEKAIFSSGTQLLGANLRNTIGLTEKQLREVFAVDDHTQLPSHLHLVGNHRKGEVRRIKRRDP
jgi:uncharacterized protein YjbI with pentapeptide repeats